MLKNSLLGLIGNTPVVRLKEIEKKYSLKTKLYAKLEFVNPAGSIKDRVALQMIESAENSGALKKGGVIIEPTSGNTGIGLSLVGKIKGYKVILTMPENMSEERVKTLKSYGAEVVLTSKDKLKVQAKKILYAYNDTENAEKIIELGRMSRNIFRKFISGQCIEAVILGILSIIGMLIFQLPYAVPIGVLIGVTALIPIVGAFIGIIIGAILILSVAPVKVITFLVYILILQQIEGNLIYPKVVGNSVGLPGIWVLVSVAVGGDLFGVIGMLLGLPTASVLYTIFKNNVYKKLDEKNIKNI